MNNMSVGVFIVSVLLVSDINIKLSKVIWVGSFCW